MARDGEHFFMYSLTIWTSFEKLCSIQLPIYLLGQWFGGSLIFQFPVYFIIPLSEV
jgi:hypothetical protein